MDLAAKLQLKAGPASRGDARSGIDRARPGMRSIRPLRAMHEPALLVFVTDRSTLEEQRAQIVAAAASDRLTWVSLSEVGSAWNRLESRLARRSS